MIPFPRYLPAQNALAVVDYPIPLPAGSLVAVRLGDQLAVTSPVDGSLICQWADFSLWGQLNDDGVTYATFGTADAAFAYLQQACQMKRPLGLAYESQAQTVWTITHTLGFVPNVVVVDTAGDNVLPDCYFPDSATVVLTFGQPTAGTAYLS